MYQRVSMNRARLLRCCYWYMAADVAVAFAAAAAAAASLNRSLGGQYIVITYAQ